MEFFHTSAVIDIMDTEDTAELVCEDIGWGNNANQKTGVNSRRWHRNFLEHVIHPTCCGDQDSGNHLWFLSLPYIIKIYLLYLHKMVQICPPLTSPTATITVQNTFIFPLDKCFTLSTLFYLESIFCPAAMWALQISTWS